MRSKNSGMPELFLFCLFRTEVNTSGMIENSLKEGRRVIFPKVDREGHNLMLFEIKSRDELTPGYMGIPELLWPQMKEERI